MRIFAVWRPNNRSPHCHNRAVGLCLGALALALGATVASGQYLESTIMLPDTLGPLNGPYHLAWDDHPAHPRLYIGGEEGDVVVADAVTYRRLARIQTKPVHEMLFCSPYRKLYITEQDKETLTVVDCVSNQVISRIPIHGRRATMAYNRFNDRLYVGSGPLTVIDCATDSILHTIAANGLALAFDSTDLKLYAGSYGALTVVDCTSDSVIASIPGVRAATKALLYNYTAKKVYAISGDTLFAVDTGSDSVVGQLTFRGLTSSLACDPQANRVYCWSQLWPPRLHAVDCAGDTSIYEHLFSITSAGLGLACDPLRDKIYVTAYRGVHILDGSTGSYIAGVGVDGRHSVPLHVPELDRVFCVPDSGALFAIDCAGDSVVGGVPTTTRAAAFCVDTVLNKLYFLTGLRAIGVADCFRHIVTSYMWQCDWPEVMVHNPVRNKLYCSSHNDNSIVVFDCTADTVIKCIYVGGRVAAMQRHPGRDKLYAFLENVAGYTVAIIDCAADSVIGNLVLPNHFPQEQLLVPEFERLWVVHDFGFVVIDIKYDTVVADTETGGWQRLRDACAAADDRKVYVSGEEYLYTIDMDNTAHIESLPRLNEGYHYLYYAAPAHKLYWACRNEVDFHDSVYVIDTRTDSVVAKFLGASQTSGMCLDRTGDYVYSSGETDTLFYTIDTRTDSVVNRISVPRNLQGFALNQRTHRIYCYPYWLDSYQWDGARIPVIYDSAGVGLYEAAAEPVGGPPYATLVSRNRPLWNVATGTLYDAAGRRTAALQPGLNDIGYLAPGVYFVREEPQASSRKPQAVRKVVVAR